MVVMIAAYVDGRPIPFSSRAFTSVASEYRGGGSVKCWFGAIEFQLELFSFLHQRQVTFFLFVLR
jgi:hypothetical protein